MPEYVSGELRAKIIDIICEGWPTPDNYLGSAAIYERLITEGIEVPDRDMSKVLLQLAEDGRIKLAVEEVAPTDESAVRNHGSMTIQDVSPELSVPGSPTRPQETLKRAQRGSSGGGCSG
jgi:hypothetical protein